MSRWGCIKDGVCMLSDVIATQDGIMNNLMHKGMAPEAAYQIKVNASHGAKKSHGVF